MRKLVFAFLIAQLTAQGASLICYHPRLEHAGQACASLGGIQVEYLGEGFFSLPSEGPKIRSEMATSEFRALFATGALFCEPNRKIGQVYEMPNDEYYTAQQHYLEAINLPQAWTISKKVFQATVAVLDTGITNHSDLEQNLFREGYNAYDDDEDVEDHDGHGTAVSGVMGAVGNNEKGIAGVVWGGRFLLTIKISEDGDVYLEPVVRAVNYILRNKNRLKIRVVNMSWGGYERSTVLEKLIKKLLDANILVVAGAGNDSKNTHQEPSYPAAFKGVLSVASVAVNPEDGSIRLSDFSNYGNVLIAAPGTEIVTTVPQDEYRVASGTSFAAPIVSGAAALYMSRYRNATAKQTFEALRISCTREPELRDHINGGCLLNVHKLLTTKPVKKDKDKKRGRRR